jgi:hypothetical protein
MSFKSIGLIWAKVRNQNGSVFKNASDYFFELDESGKYTMLIADLMEKHVTKYFPKYESDKNVWQVEFGGDGSNGLIDYALQTPPPRLPMMLFEIQGHTYVMDFQE